MRLYATIRRSDIHPPTRHFMGMPQSVDPHGNAPIPQAWPCALVIDASATSAILDRFASDGSSVGDTWHQSIDDAKDQAVAEYDGLLTEWRPVPAEVADAELAAYVLQDVE